MRLAGNLKTKFVTIDSDSVLPKEQFTTILADASGGTITITLNDVGFEFTIIRIDNTVGQTVDLISNDATGTVDFVTTYSIANQGEAVVVVPNGINFYLKNDNRIYNGFIGLYYILCLYQENNEDLNKMIKAIMKHETKQHNKNGEGLFWNRNKQSN